MRASSSDQLFTPDQVAERLGLHVRTVRRHIREGRLEAVRVGRRYRITRAALEAFAGIPADAETARARPGTDVSTVIAIEDVDHAAAERLTTHLLASAGGRRDGAPPLRIETIHDPERRRLKLVCSGDLASTLSLLALVNAVLGEVR